MKRKDNKNRRPIPYFGLQLSLFIVLVALTCLERIVSGFSISVDVSCLDQRTLILGASDADVGIHEALMVISVAALIVILVDQGLNWWSPADTRQNDRLLAIVNAGLALAMLALCAIPWAHYNVGHPLSDRTYSVQNALDLRLPYVEPIPIDYTRRLDSEVWNCQGDMCLIPHDQASPEFTHRELGVSFKQMLVAECMSPEFNLATLAAIGKDTGNFSGVRQRYADIWFDEAGRFVGPDRPWVKTSLLVSQLTPEQLLPSDWAFDALVDAVFPRYDARERLKPKTIPKWVSWETASEILKSGQVSYVFVLDDIRFCFELNDGTILLGTMPAIDALNEVIELCDEKCADIDLRLR